MKVFLARQPILDSKQRLFGYELLFRDGEDNKFPDVDGDSATIEVIKNSFVNIGIDKVTNGKKAFINFTENVLKSDVLSIIKPEHVIVEVLENIEPTKEVVDTCRVLKERGFTLALDDFVFHEKYRDLIELADIIKVDFSITKDIDRKKVMTQVKSKKIKFLAEKVETLEEYDQAIKWGYSYFQGYFFSKPVIISQKQIPENQVVYLKILSQLNKADFSLEKIEELIKKDVSISLKLLRLINSAQYNFVSNITSLKQAMTLIGEEQMKKWLYLITIKSIGSNKPQFVVSESLARARFCELLAIEAGYKQESFSAYLVGMLSKIDVLLDMPLDKVIQELNVQKEVENALFGEEETPLKLIKKITTAYAGAQWCDVERYSKRLGLDSSYIPQAYFESIKWADND